MSESDSSNSVQNPGGEPDAQALDMTALVAHSADESDSSNSEADLPGGWRFESQRWLATLNPGRTQREYQKAVSYFFVTSGVPQQITALTFDLLLAYRGALAMRATAHTEIQPRRSTRSGPRARLSGVAPAQLEGQGGDAAEAAKRQTGPVRRAIQARSHLPQSTSGSPRCASSSSIARSTGRQYHSRPIRFVRRCGVSALSADDHIRRWQNQSGRSFWWRRGCQRNGSQVLPLRLKLKVPNLRVQRVPGVCRAPCEKRPAG